MEDDNPALPLGFAEERAVFKGATQNARVLTEGWVADHLFCPNCGEDRLKQHPPNRPAADFLCPQCDEDYELKGKRGRLGGKVLDGAYSTMLERVTSERTPNLLVMSYGGKPPAVSDLIVVPKSFITPGLIEAKRPTWPKGRSAPWTGCSILLRDVPEIGRIDIVRDRTPLSKAEVRARWDQTVFLRGRSLNARGWLLDVLRCVERLGPVFTIQDVYGFEGELAALYPGNNNIRPKIRQQLQMLRDAGVVRFLGAGRYERVV